MPVTTLWPNLIGLASRWANEENSANSAPIAPNATSAAGLRYHGVGWS
ncbi:hypothetical protein MOBUDSM44075_04010 [Mycolicibacterium obuense]|uniref:Uncharacterized protein n=1 Tax=Mycolicibacterium obuense TaxID=1807 RepID=A0A0J6VT87_9MYCO|nr:hypothetical protein MOBUDSM44075_04010 [Mycolicibacterium obuense]